MAHLCLLSIRFEAILQTNGKNYNITVVHSHQQFLSTFLAITDVIYMAILASILIPIFISVHLYFQLFNDIVLALLGQISAEENCIILVVIWLISYIT